MMFIIAFVSFVFIRDFLLYKRMQRQEAQIEQLQFQVRIAHLEAELIRCELTEQNENFVNTVNTESNEHEWIEWLVSFSALR